MSYIGNQPVYQAFVTDQFSGNGSTTAFTMSVAPANTASVLVAVSGVLQDPSTYSVSGTTLTFSAAPPSGTGNISARYLGIPASGVTTTAYRTVTEFTATAGQTTFTPPSYTAGYINVYRNGVRLGSADYTATNGTTVVLATGATSGDIVTVESYYVSSVVGAIPATAGSVTSAYIQTGGVLAVNMGANGTWAPAGTIIQVVQGTAGNASTTSTSFVTTGLSASITPKFSTSKILILVALADVYNGSVAQAGTFTIYRGSTNIAPSGSGVNQAFAYYWTNASGPYQNTTNFNYLDSPATTSSTTYTVYFSTQGGTLYTAINGQTSTIQLLEVTA